MGTIFDQRPRGDYMRSHVTERDVERATSAIIDIVEDLGCTKGEAIALYGHLCVERQTACMIAAGDTHDEQIAGAAEIVQKGIAAIVSAIEERS